MPMFLYIVASGAKTLKTMEVIPTIIKLLAPEGLSDVAVFVII